MTDPKLVPEVSKTEVLSPFLPGTQIQFAFDSTSLGYLKTCPRLYQYIMIEGWATKEDKIHLIFGQLYHSALETYDHLLADGANHADALRETVRQTLIASVDFNPDEDTKAGKYKNRVTLLRLVIEYLDKYGKDDPAKTFVLQSGAPAVELSFRFELDWGPASEEGKSPVGDQITAGDITAQYYYKQPFLLSGHLDRVVTLHDELYVMDRKTTTTTLGDYFFKQFEPHNQMTLYTLASQVILGSPVKGVIIDAAQILLDNPNRYVRGFTYRTTDQLEEWTADLRYWLSVAENFAVQGYWPMNDTACDKFGGCMFREICSKSPSVRDRFLAGKFTKLEEADKWNPLKPR